MNKIMIWLLLSPLVVNAQVQPDTTTRPAGVNLNKVHPLPASYDSSRKVNYIRTWDVSKPYASEADVISNSRTVGEVKQTTQFFDGLGRPLQTVSKGMSVSGNDIVAPILYDDFGREVFKYLPYSQIANNTNDGGFKFQPFYVQASFFNNATYNPGLTGEQIFYGKTVYENSMLSRPDSVFAPGNSWGGSHIGVSMKYEINSVTDSVRIWTINQAIGSTPSSVNIYAAGELFKSVNYDEHNKRVIEFKNKEGQIVLKKVQLAASPSAHHTGWLCTYYVYDDFGNLRFVIPPKGVEAITGIWVIDTTVKDELCFRYEYDGRKRMIIKKVPGAGEVRMVYDARDRLVLTQDANLLASSNWMVMHYDDLNRVTSTWLLSDGNNRAYHETEAANEAVYPSQTQLDYYAQRMTATYYDNYEWLGGGLSSTLITTYNSNTSYFYNASNTVAPYPQAITVSYETKGMVTGTATRVLGSADNLYSVNFYDDRARIVQTQSINQSGGKDTVTMQYDFSGKVLRTLVCHAKSGTNAQSHIVLTKNEYDNAGRLSAVKKKMNNSPEVTITSNTYDELGQLKQKNIGRKRDAIYQNTYTGYAMDSLKYSYNIRGWLRGINKEYARGEAGADNWFGMELSYDVGFSQDQLNGNIAGVRWKSNGSDIQRSYGFSYDAVNRLMKADFTQQSGGAWNTSGGIDFSMKMGDGTIATTAYDANGNIISMWQKGLTINLSVTIDSLTYDYQTASNKLAKVTDAVTGNNKLGDFTDVNTAYDDYSYDANGNMEYDRNKGISKIFYNHLNLPDSIRILGKGTIKYIYDAAGNKQQKKTVDSTVTGTKTTITTYFGGFVYQNDTLQFAAHEEGRIREKRIGGKDTMYYDYFIKDHLGNVRMVLTDEIKTDVYFATHEISGQAYEQELFSNYSTADKPDGFDNDHQTKVHKLGAARSGTQVLGEGIILKVMAGDKINASIYGMSGRGGTISNQNWEQLISTVFTTGIQQSGGGKGATFTAITDIISPQVTLFIDDLETQATEMNGFLNWIFLDDEQLKYDENYSGITELSSSITNEKVLLQANGGDTINIGRNGYIYFFVSNMSTSSTVYFDNFFIEHIRGPLVEETHFYPFGLTMAGISSKAAQFGQPDNKIKFQGQEFAHGEFSDGGGLDMYEFKWRMDDPQTGRFWQVDPLADEYVYNSPYAFSENKVTAHIELEGLEAISAGKPEAYLAEGFRQMFQAIGNLFSFKAEVHVNKEVEVKTEAKTPAGSVENKTTTTVSENKVEVTTNFGNYFKYGGGNLVEVKAESNTMSKVENTTTATVNTNGAPIKASSKTTVDQNGTSQTTSVGTGASVDAGKVKANVSATGFVTQQQTGANAGQYNVGFKAAADATFVSKKVVILNTPAVKVSTSTQTTVGGSVTQQYRFPW